MQGNADPSFPFLPKLLSQKSAPALQQPRIMSFFFNKTKPFVSKQERNFQDRHLILHKSAQPAQPKQLVHLN